MDKMGKDMIHIFSIMYKYTWIDWLLDNCDSSSQVGVYISVHVPHVKKQKAFQRICYFYINRRNIENPNLMENRQIFTPLLV